MTMNQFTKKILHVNSSVEKIEILEKEKEIHIHLKERRNSIHKCPHCGKNCSCYDTISICRKRRHLDFGEYKVLIFAKVRRINCAEHGVCSEQVSWAYHNSRFTKMMEHNIAYYGTHLSKCEAARICRISWNTVGPIISRVKNIIEPNFNDRKNNLKIIGIDETSYKKGHKYITTIIDQITKQVVHIYEGKTADGLVNFFKSLTTEQRNSIEIVTGDGAKWIANTVKKYLPNAEFCIDAFHVVERVVEAMDELRKDVWKNLKQFRDSKPEKGSHKKSKQTKEKLERYDRIKKLGKYSLGKNPSNLTEKQLSFIETDLKFHPKLLRAYEMKELLRNILHLKDPGQAEIMLKNRCFRASHMKSESFKTLYKKIKSRFVQIINTIRYGVSNALIESFNNKIKLLVRKAYGFRNLDNLKDLIYLTCSPSFEKVILPYEFDKVFTHTN